MSALQHYQIRFIGSALWPLVSSQIAGEWLAGTTGRHVGGRGPDRIMVVGKSATLRGEGCEAWVSVGQIIAISKRFAVSQSRESPEFEHI